MTLARAPSCSGRSPTLPVGQERVRLLYEEYVHFSWLKQVWDHPVTDRPGLEPCFAAAFHGIELAFLQMAEFITDRRTYVAKRPRIEAMAMDIRAQLQLLGDLVDGELEEEGQPISTSLTQNFPFEGCPPTTPCPGHSPGLDRFIQAVQRLQGNMSSAESNSLMKVSLQITSAFQSAFLRWTVGLGIEHQLNTLLKIQGIKQPGALLVERSHNLDYAALVRPQVVEATLTAEVYENAEDFFFRSIHLGTECWMYVANTVAAAALRYARDGQWHVAAARVMQAARILNYLGEHIMTLTRMNLRDYLELKVQLEGTSGAGSSMVRAIRGLVLSLMDPFKAAVLQLQPGSRDSAPEGSAADTTAEEEQLMLSVLYLYNNCDKHAGLYNYAKALEDVESALLGGFYYKHYCLAANVIGSEARGTMRRAVAALKSSYERQLFPVLDAVRAQLGKDFDAQLSHMKGRMMDAILIKYSATDATAPNERQQAMIPTAVASMASAAVASSTMNMASAAAAGMALAAATALHRENSLSESDGHVNCGQPKTVAHAHDMQHTGHPNGIVLATKEDVSGCPFMGGVTNGKQSGDGQDEDKEESVSGCPFMAVSGCPFGPALVNSSSKEAAGHAHGQGMAAGKPEGMPSLPARPSRAVSLHVSGILLDTAPAADSTASTKGEDAAACNGTDTNHSSSDPTAQDSTAITNGNGAAAHDSTDASHGGSITALLPNVGSHANDRSCRLNNTPAAVSDAEASRQWLYSSEGLPEGFMSWLPHSKLVGKGRSSNQSGLSFLDHAFGEVPVRVLEAGLRGMAEAAAQGNASWETLFSKVLPKASQHVLNLLGAAHLQGPAAPHVHWGHNSHELVWRCLSNAVLQASQDAPFKVLTTDTEFYSFTRQLNKLRQLGDHVCVEVVPAQPCHTFTQRLVGKAAEQKPHLVYCSQVTYLTQQVLIPDVSTFVPQLAQALSSDTETNTTAATIADASVDGNHGAVTGGTTQQRAPMVIIDGYHGFCAVPIDLSQAYSCPAVASGQVLLGYVAGLLKHAGCGPNAAFMVLGGSWRPEPLNTGWLADMSVLAPGSAGIKPGSPVGYTPELALQGSTPAYGIAVMSFCGLMDAWQHPPAGSPISVQAVHTHVASLQHQFLQGLKGLEEESTSGHHKRPLLTIKQLVSHSQQRFDGPAPPQATGGSSTLAFDCDTTQQAAEVVAHFAAHGIASDARKQYVRIGFGFNHDKLQVAKLLQACTSQ